MMKTGTFEMILDFPGNVREQESAIEHADVMSRGAWIDIQHLPREISGAGAAGLPDQDAAPDDLIFMLGLRS